MHIEPTMGAVLNVIFKRKRAAISAIIIPAMLGTAYLLIATPKYRSEAAVIVRFDQAAVPTTDMARESKPEVTAANDRREIVEAHTDILTNPDLARQVIESVGLKTAYPKIFNNPPAVGTAMDVAVLRFEKSMVADAEISGDVINLSFLHPDPKLAQVMLAKLIELYKQQEAALFSASDFAFNREETGRAAQRLAAAQTELHAYKARFNISSFNDQITDLVQQRSDLSASLQTTQVNLEQTAKHRDELTQLLTTVPATLSNSSGDKYHSYDDALTNLATLTQKKKEMMVTYREDSPLLSQLRASIENSKADVAQRHADLARRDATAPNTVYQSIQTDLLRTTASARSLETAANVENTQLAALDQQLSTLEAARSGYDDRLRAVQVSENAYRSLAMHLEDARVSESKFKGGISHGAVLTAPSLPFQIAKPRYLILIVAFALGSLLAGIVTAIALELLDDRFTSADQIAHAFRLPILATLDKAG